MKNMYYIEASRDSDNEAGRIPSVQMGLKNNQWHNSKKVKFTL